MFFRLLYGGGRSLAAEAQSSAPRESTCNLLTCGFALGNVRVPPAAPAAGGSMRTVAACRRRTKVPKRCTKGASRMPPQCKGRENMHIEPPRSTVRACAASRAFGSLGRRGCTGCPLATFSAGIEASPSRGGRGRRASFPRFAASRVCRCEIACHAAAASKPAGSSGLSPTCGSEAFSLVIGWQPLGNGARRAARAAGARAYHAGSASRRAFAPFSVSKGACPS